MMEASISGAAPRMRKRNETISLMKGIIVISIVFTHIFSQVDKGNANEQPVVTGMIYMCLMSFFIISGYYFNPKRCYLENVKKRIKQLVIPISLCIIILPLILFAYLYLVGQPQPFSDYTNNVINFLLGESRFGLRIDDIPNENIPIMISLGYYFLMTMASSFLLFYAIANKAMKNERTLIIVIAILLVIQAVFVETIEYYLPYFLQIVPIATAFMLVGSWFAKKGSVEKMESLGWKNRKVIACFFIALALDIVMVIFFRPDDELIAMYFGSYGGLSVFPYFVIGVLSSICFFCACMLLVELKPLSSLFIIAGNHSLAIILLHEFIIKILISPFYTLPSYPLTKEFPELPMEIAIIVATLTVVIAVVLGIAFDRIGTKWKTRCEQCN